MRKLSIATALLLGTAVFATAADDLASAFKEGKIDGRLRMQYFNNIWDDNSATGKNTANGTGLSVGGSLLYKTAPLYGISLGTGLYTTQNPGHITGVNDGAGSTTGADLFSRDSHYEGTTKVGEPYGTGYAVLAQAYLEYALPSTKTKAKAGRFLMTNPWITPNDTKMIPIAVEGLEGVTTDIANTKIQIDYANKWKERGMTYFGNMADGLDVPNAIRKNYDTHYNAPNAEKADEAPGVLIAGITNKSIDGLQLELWGMHWDDLVDQVMFEGNYAFEAGDVIIGLGGRYIKQYDKGAGALIKPMTNNGDTDQSIDSHLWALKATANYGPTGFLISMSETSDDGDMIAPWRGFLTQTYTRSMTVTDWNANTKAYKALVSYDFNQMISGLSSFASYSFYDRDPSKTPYSSATNRAFQNGDTKQWNLDLIYAMAGSFKGTELKLRLMDQNNEKGKVTDKELSEQELRFEVNYRF
ncbi:OprD family outer membrane porin [Sulfuricurvum sp.]|uniref:OprD family outer membrane porin n=1 Tax=Sulfuricurvum sp. TaxID=2025608 RepID=UPI002625EDB2|nr:OprD family outer membrane porin [Sulfuricurvum sp.]MDD2781157.1 OprD family outer membrane porin [Sulfuricurvum sp.]